MYEYSIFWIKDEIAKHYYHRSDILFRFFREYQNNRERIDLTSQYAYLTHEFPFSKLIYHLKKSIPEDLTIQTNGANVEINKNDQYIALQIGNNHLKFRCKTLQDAEVLLFPMLRKFQLFLFITGDNTDNYGWISPVINKTNPERRQVLYSSY